MLVASGAEPSAPKLELTEHRFEATTRSGDVSALLMRPVAADCLLVLGHGAGAGMRHPFMEALAAHLADRRIATFRYQFPYVEHGRRRPDYQPILLKTIRSAASAASVVSDGLPLFAGGKSMGGRMTSLAASSVAASDSAASKGSLSMIQGIVFFGFPLHPAQKPGVERGEHLKDVGVPLLFLQGTRDKLARLDLLEPVYRDLGRRATLHLVEGADHGFHVLKRSGRSEEEVMDELADTTRSWIDGLVPGTD